MVGVPRISCFFRDAEPCMFMLSMLIMLIIMLTMLTTMLKLLIMLLMMLTIKLDIITLRTMCLIIPCI